MSRIYSLSQIALLETVHVVHPQVLLFADLREHGIIDTNEYTTLNAIADTVTGFRTPDVEAFNEFYQTVYLFLLEEATHG